MSHDLEEGGRAEKTDQGGEEEEEEDREGAEKGERLWEQEAQIQKLQKEMRQKIQGMEETLREKEDELQEALKLYIEKDQTISELKDTLEQEQSSRFYYFYHLFSGFDF